MNCFDTTCGITNTAIRIGESCIMVDLNEPFPILDEYDLAFNHLFSCTVRQKDLSTEDRCSYDFPIRSILFGIYNDYGSIFDLETDNKGKRLFFHTWIVEWLLKKNVEELKQDPLSMVKEILKKCMYLRRSPLSSDLRGMQHDWVDELKEQIKFNNEVNKYLRSKIKTLKELK